MWNIFDIAVFGAGFAVCWFSKDRIILAFTGTATFVSALEAKAAALKARL